MKGIRFLTEKEVIFINALVIKRYSPSEQVGVKNYNLLDSALNRPKQSAFGEDTYPSFWLKAATLYASLCQHHAFHNANKRTGFAAMKQFLWVNGYMLKVSEKDAEEYTLVVVIRKPSINETAAWLEENAVER
jgi:death-on-curing protein